MNIFFEGRWPQQERFEQYVRDVLNHFFKGKLKREIDIHLRLVRKQTDLGYCVGDRNEVTIEMCRSHDNHGGLIPINDLAKTLAHELVHAKQFIRGEINDRNYIYGKKDYKHASYRQQPWEHEAYMLEDFLHNLYWINRKYLDITYEVFQ